MEISLKGTGVAPLHEGWKGTNLNQSNRAGVRMSARQTTHAHKLSFRLRYRGLHSNIVKGDDIGFNPPDPPGPAVLRQWRQTPGAGAAPGSWRGAGPGGWSAR